MELSKLSVGAFHDLGVGVEPLQYLTDRTPKFRSAISKPTEEMFSSKVFENTSATTETEEETGDDSIGDDDYDSEDDEENEVADLAL